MNLYDFTKKYGEGKGADMMWRTVEAISEFVEDNMSEEERKKLLRKLYCIMSDGHYNEEYALEDVSKMYYKDKEGKKQYAPYWTASDVKSVYDSVKSKIPEYNFWDFYVTLNMSKSDVCPLIKSWFPESNEEERTKMLVEYALAWLNDEDNPYGNKKPWMYLNSK